VACQASLVCSLAVCLVLAKIRKRKGQQGEANKMKAINKRQHIGVIGRGVVALVSPIHKFKYTDEQCRYDPNGVNK
jgi:cellobiose-specific phosphotransferase system component IIB